MQHLIYFNPYYMIGYTYLIEFLLFDEHCSLYILNRFDVLILKIIFKK
jgi:hypothetical protein